MADSTSLESLVSWCRGREQPMLALLGELVEQNSFSQHHEGGERVAAILERELGTIAGVGVKRIDSAEHAPHVVAVSDAAQASADGCVALVGHHDTVFPPATFEGFRIEGDVARGPGVLDMKSGLTLAIEALRALSSQGLLGEVPIRFVSVSDEEIGSPEGADVLARELSGAACALVFEAGRADDVIITSRKGTGGVRAIAHGKAAHSGNHHADGANAIWTLARFVEAVQQLTDYERGVTVNVGTIAGGQSRNTVPDRAEALIDVRFVSRADGEAAVERMRALAAEVCLPGTSIELDGGVKRPPLERSDANVALYREYAACAKLAGLGDGEAPLIGGGSDASTTAALGIASIDGLGPRGSGFHTHDELIEISTLVPRLEALVRFLWGRRAMRKVS
jgi:glutamate carboxypeptidase